MEECDLSPALAKLRAQCAKLATNGDFVRYRRLLHQKRALLGNIQLQDHHVVTVEQALKDAAREKIVLNDEHYRGGWDELHRLRADLLELTTDLVAKDECCTALSAATLADLVLTQASRTRNGADAYFTAKLIFEPGGGDWVLKPMDRDTSPIDLKLFPWGGAIFGQVSSMNQYGLWRVSDLMDFEDPPPRHPVDVLVVEQIDFNNDRSMRFLRFLEAPTAKPKAAVRKRRLRFLPCCSGPRGQTTPERPAAAAPASGGSSSSGDSSSSNARAAVAPSTPSRRNLMGARRFQPPAHETRSFETVPEGVVGDEQADEPLTESTRTFGGSGGGGEGGGEGGGDFDGEGGGEAAEELAAKEGLCEEEALHGAAESKAAGDSADSDGGEAAWTGPSNTSNPGSGARVNVSSRSGSGSGNSNREGASHLSHAGGWPSIGPISFEENHVTKMLFSLFDATAAPDTAAASDSGPAPAPSSSGSSGGGESSGWFELGPDPLKWFDPKAKGAASPVDADAGTPSTPSTPSSSSSSVPGSAPAGGFFGMPWPLPFQASPAAAARDEDGWMANMFRLQQRAGSSVPAAAAAATDLVAEGGAAAGVTAPGTPATPHAFSLAAGAAIGSASVRRSGPQARSRSASLASFGESSGDCDSDGGSSGDAADFVVDAIAAPLRQDALLGAYFHGASPAAASSAEGGRRSSRGGGRAPGSEPASPRGLELPLGSPLRPPAVLSSPASTRRRSSWAGSDGLFLSPGSAHSAAAGSGNGGNGGGVGSRKSSFDAEPGSSSSGPQLPLFPPILPPSSEINDLLPVSAHLLFARADSKELSVELAARASQSRANSGPDCGRPASAPPPDSTRGAWSGSVDTTQRPASTSKSRRSAPRASSIEARDAAAVAADASCSSSHQRQNSDLFLPVPLP